MEREGGNVDLVVCGQLRTAYRDSLRTLDQKFQPGFEKSTWLKFPHILGFDESVFSDRKQIGEKFSTSLNIGSHP